MMTSTDSVSLNTSSNEIIKINPNNDEKFTEDSVNDKYNCNNKTLKKNLDLDLIENDRNTESNSGDGLTIENGKEHELIGLTQNADITTLLTNGFHDDDQSIVNSNGSILNAQENICNGNEKEENSLSNENVKISDNVLRSVCNGNVDEPIIDAIHSNINIVQQSEVELKECCSSDDADISQSNSLSPASERNTTSSLESEYHLLEFDIKKEYLAEIESLKCRISDLEKQASHETCNNQIATMDKAVQQIQLELNLNRQEQELDRRTFANEKAELETTIEHLKKDFHSANKEKEAAVVRYACGEMELMNIKKERLSLDKKLKDCTKEKELLMNKLKSVTSDKTRVCQMLDTKCSDLSIALKEIETMKDELNTREIKIKWVQNKLKSETDFRKDLEIKIELLNTKVVDTIKEADQAKLDAQMSIKQFQESEENRAYILDQQLKEEQVKLMMVQHELDENERAKKQLLQDLEECRSKLHASLEENNNLVLKIQMLEQERLEYEDNVSSLKHRNVSQSKIIGDLQDSVKELDALKIQLKCEQDRVVCSQSELERLRQSNSEVLVDMESCRKREADMLEFTQKLTAKNVRLQSEFTAVEAKVQQLECEEAPLQKRIKELESRTASLLSDLEKEKQQRTEENKVLARHLAEKTAKAKSLETHVEELTNEIQLVKRKNGATIKELNKELSQMRRRIEHNSESGSESLNQGSRASSCTSLNDHSLSVPSCITSQPNSVSAGTIHPSSIQAALHINTKEPSRQALIERIVKLQRDNAKLNEKIDFLEEHARTLLEEVQKKSKVLQSYVLREEAGALSSRSMDLNKAELAKHGGIMASVYGSKAVDDHMTLELSLEINRKLQAVLEDTLLKNITLKENIDTLGDEISRLSKNKKNHF